VEAAYNRIKLAFRGEMSKRSPPRPNQDGDEREQEDIREDPVTKFKGRLM